MSDFLAARLDFILFFFGLSFVLLGTAAFGLGGFRRTECWHLLGAFGLLNGAQKWSELAAVTFGDDHVFASARFVPLVGSYLPMIEFARRGMIEQGMRMPGRWILLVFLVLAVPS